MRLMPRIGDIIRYTLRGSARWVGCQALRLLAGAVSGPNGAPPAGSRYHILIRPGPPAGFARQARQSPGPERWPDSLADTTPSPARVCGRAYLFTTPLPMRHRLYAQGADGQDVPKRPAGRHSMVGTRPAAADGLLSATTGRASGPPAAGGPEDISDVVGRFELRPTQTTSRPARRCGRPRRPGRRLRCAALSADSASSSGCGRDPSTPVRGGCRPWRSSASQTCDGGRDCGDVGRNTISATALSAS
jgi:hypothetical protein